MSNKGSLYILYGSQTGQGEEIAKQIHEAAVNDNYAAELGCLQDEGKKYKIEEIKCAVFVCSTTGDGDPPENARKFIRSISKKSLSDDHLAHLNFALLGLGDTNYSNFCGGPKKLEKALKARGATSFYPTALADDATDMEETVEPWIDGLFPAIELYFTSSNPLISNNLICEISNDPTSSDSDVANKVTDEFDKLNVTETDEGLRNDTQVTHVTEKKVEIPVLNNGNRSTIYIPPLIYNSLLSSFTLSQSSLTIPPLLPCYLEMNFLSEKFIDMENVPYQNAALFPLAVSPTIKALVSNGQRLTRADALKKSLEIQLSLKECYPYEPGDSLALCCENDVKEVNWLINRLSLETVDCVPAQLRVKDGSTKKSAVVPAYIPDPFTIRYVLHKCLEIRAVPKKPFLRALVECTTDSKEKRRLQELCSRQGALEYSVKVRGASICILDLLAIFQSCKPNFELLVQHLPRLKPRRYSITTSRLKHPDTLKFVFNVVKFDVDNGRVFSRKGVCTGYMENIFENLKSLSTPEVSIFLTKPTGFRLPADMTIPVVLIGPGTGVAPFVGFLEHRKALGVSLGEAWLFYGCRHKDKDFLYQKELEAFKNEGVLTKLIVAFSRDISASTESKAKYVQDNLRIHSCAVIDLLLNKNAVFYVCGDARNMAKDTRECLIDLIAAETKCDKHIAVEKFQHVLSEHRYREDVWT